MFVKNIFNFSYCIKKKIYLCGVNKIFIKIIKNMETTANATPENPDFLTVLKSLMESGRRMNENYERYLKERKEREAK